MEVLGTITVIVLLVTLLVVTAVLVKEVFWGDFLMKVLILSSFFLGVVGGAITMRIWRKG